MALTPRVLRLATPPRDMTPLAFLEHTTYSGHCGSSSSCSYSHSIDRLTDDLLKVNQSRQHSCTCGTDG